MQWQFKPNLIDRSIRPLPLSTGHNVPMPPDLLELYNLYQQELEQNEKDALFIDETKDKIMRVRMSWLSFFHHT